MIEHLEAESCIVATVERDNNSVEWLHNLWPDSLKIYLDTRALFLTFIVVRLCASSAIPAMDMLQTNLLDNGGFLN